ncbi:unnamed protein product [Effrenium voratum]|uniref:Uncharacterized protein n=1 Tax=Effrenium voratum TaxID=2562239 RepID=A0AA36HM80_9DINO|nr:unnamed protein product [Effrenium voratum]CAJ1415522.1 unnamed protein product [Effrenium voratum]
MASSRPVLGLDHGRVTDTWRWIWQRRDQSKGSALPPLLPLPKEEVRRRLQEQRRQMQNPSPRGVPRRIHGKSPDPRGGFATKSSSPSIASGVRQCGGLRRIHGKSPDPRGGYSTKSAPSIASGVRQCGGLRRIHGKSPDPRGGRIHGKSPEPRSRSPLGNASAPVTPVRPAPAAHSNGSKAGLADVSAPRPTRPSGRATELDTRSRPASEVTHRLRCKSPDPRKSGQDTTRAPREPLCPGLLRRLLGPEPRLRADVCKEVEVHQDEASRILAEMRLARAGQHSR